MRVSRWLLVAALLFAAARISAAGEAADSAAVAVADSARLMASPDSAAGIRDEAWLKTIWSQIDTLIRQEDFEIQETVVTGGTRGEEGKDALVDQYYYFKGGRYYPSQKLVGKVIETLEKKLDGKPGKEDRARFQYLAALCYDILGEQKKAREYYGRVVDTYSKGPYATRAKERLQQLNESEKGMD